MDERSAVINSLGASQPGKKVAKHVHDIRIERGASGGYAAHHTMKDKDGNSHGTTGPHVLASKKAMLAHVDAMIGDHPDAGKQAGAGEGSGLEGEAGAAGEQ